MFNFIKNILAPKKCYSCGQEWHFLCPKCMSKMSTFESICYVCKRKSIKFSIHYNCQKLIVLDKIIILTHYKQKLIKKLIKDAKYYYKKDILEDFSIYLSKLLLENIENKNIDNYILVPMPMYYFRKWQRWYNQSEVLAKNIWKITKIMINNNLIKRVKNTRQQSKLSKKERLKNLTNAFKINKNLVDKIDKNKIIIIVDDVISTWTSINSIAKLLKDYWFKNVIWLIIASD